MLIASRWVADKLWRGKGRVRLNEPASYAVEPDAIVRFGGQGEETISALRTGIFVSGGD